MTRRRTPREAVIRLNTGRTAHASIHRYPYRMPVLALDFGALSVLVTPRDDTVTVADVEFARQLAREADRFARSLERHLLGLPNGAGVAA
jgi:hypothetical protein